MRATLVLIGGMIANLASAFGLRHLVAFAVRRLITGNPLLALAVEILAWMGLHSFVHRVVIVPLFTKAIAWGVTADAEAREPKCQPNPRSFGHPIAA